MVCTHEHAGESAARGSARAGVPPSEGAVRGEHQLGRALGEGAARGSVSVGSSLVSGGSGNLPGELAACGSVPSRRAATAASPRPW
jgi:hypothetical protein